MIIDYLLIDWASWPYDLATLWLMTCILLCELHVSLLANICVLYHIISEKSTEIENKFRDLPLCA